MNEHTKQPVRMMERIFYSMQPSLSLSRFLFLFLFLSLSRELPLSFLPLHLVTISLQACTLLLPTGEMQVNGGECLHAPFSRKRREVIDVSPFTRTHFAFSQSSTGEDTREKEKKIIRARAEV